jgi:hypothetical protein
MFFSRAHQSTSDNIDNKTLADKEWAFWKRELALKRILAEAQEEAERQGHSPRVNNHKETERERYSRERLARRPRFFI